MKRSHVILGVAVLASTLMIPLSANAQSNTTTTTAASSYTTPTSTLNVPKTQWPVCSANFVTWCISGVSIQSAGEKSPEALTWVPSGTALGGASSTTTSAPTTTTTAASSTTTTTSPATTKEGSAVTGYWTDATWSTYGHDAGGFGGLYVQAAAANVFSNYMLFNVEPAIQDGSSNKTYIADQAKNNYPASLNTNDVITVSLETGNAQTGVTMAIANNFSAQVGSDANGTTYTFSASPVPVPIASSSTACTGETGVAAAEANEVQVIVAPLNDPTSGFGVDGVSGKMYVESNGPCSLSTPVWNSSTQQLSWTVAAPHFADDGTTVNQGFYQAMIPGADANALWGLTNVNQAASALTITETSTGDASTNTSVGSISVKNGNIIISYTGFQYSKPTFTIKKNPKYQFTAPKAITCVNIKNPKLTKVVRAVNPVCPSGYKKKA
jgi:hypothetical protein